MHKRMFLEKDFPIRSPVRITAPTGMEQSGTLLSICPQQRIITVSISSSAQKTEEEKNPLADVQEAMKDPLVRKAISLLEDYCNSEYGSHLTLSDWPVFPIAYTTTLDDKHDIQAYIDLKRFRVYTLLDNMELVRVNQFQNLEEMVKNFDWVLDFETLIQFDGEEDYE